MTSECVCLFINNKFSQKRTKQVFINLQKRLQNLCVEIREKRMDNPEFLASVGHLIRLNLVHVDWTNDILV